MKTSITITIAVIFMALSIVGIKHQITKRKEEIAKDNTPVKIHLKPLIINSRNAFNTFSFIGTVVSEQTLTLLSETDGEVIRVCFETGQQVKAGQIIAYIDSSLKTIQCSAYRTAYQKAEKDYERLKQLNNENNASDYDLENAALAAKQAEAQYRIAARDLENTRITTPIDGIIADKKIGKGDYLQPGTPISIIVNDNKLIVKSLISESDVHRIKRAMPVKITTSNNSNLPVINGQIKTIVPPTSLENGFPIEITIESSAGLMPGMNVRITVEECLNDMILIPVTSLSGDLSSPKICKMISGKPEFVPVQTGIRMGNNIEIISGLNNQDTIIISGQSNILDNPEGLFVLSFN